MQKKNKPWVFFEHSVLIALFIAQKATIQSSFVAILRI